MLSPNPRVLVVGYNAFDVTVPVTGSAPPDSKQEVTSILLGGGGPGATAAVTLARLGAEVRLVTPLTDDLPGQMQRQELIAAGVNIEHSPLFAGYAAARAVIMVDAAREQRTIYWCRGDLPLLGSDQVKASWLDSTDLLYVDGHEPEAAETLACVALERGIPVVMDAGSVREGSEQLVQLCTDVIGSETFAPALTGQSDPLAALRDLQARGPVRVAMTFGSGGILYLEEGCPRAVPAFAVPVLDTTGAGDAFHAGYAFARATGQPFRDSLRFGAAVAALKCGDWGGRRGLPDLDSALRLCQNGPTRPLDSCLAGFPTQ